MDPYVLDTILCVFELLILKTITTEREIVFFSFFKVSYIQFYSLYMD
jgi:hypothetical protein